MTARSVELAERRAAVLRLRSEGKTWQQIAAELAPTLPSGKYSSRAAFADGQRALEEAQEDLKGMALLHMALEMERLDALRRVTEEVLAEARAESNGLQALRAVDRLIRVGQRTDALLGLSRVSAEAVGPAEGGERPHAQDSSDEVARKRAARRLNAKRTAR